MNKSIASILSLSLLTTLFFIGTQNALAETNPALPSVMAQALDKELGGTLTPSEMTAIEKAEAEQRAGTEAFNPLFVSELNRLNFLVCVSGKAATVAKGRVGVCSNTKGQIYRLFGYGAGLSAGAQLSVFGMVVVTQTPNAAIAGDYGSATSVSQSGLGFLVQNMFNSSAWRVEVNALMRFLFVFGGPEFAMAQSPDSYLIMAGAGLGPMLDLGVEWFRIIESPR